MRRRHLYVWLVAISLANLVMVRAARAQDEVEPDEGRAAPPGGAFDLADDEMEDYFKHSFFNQLGGEDNARARLEADLAARIRDIDLTYGLTAEQEKKLLVAGKRDIYLFFDEIERKKKDLSHSRDNRAKYQAILWNLHILREKIINNALFDDTSRFARFLKTVLSREQFGERAGDVFRARVEWVVASLDDRLGLSEDQHRRLAALIVKETPPLKRFGEHDVDAVLFQASGLSGERLGRILDERQLRLLSDEFLEARAHKPVLDEKGYLAGEGPEQSPRGEGAGAGTDRGKPVRNGITDRK